MKTGLLKKVNTPLVVSICATFLAILGFLYGPGVLLRPNLKVSCGAFNLRTPVKLKMELMIWKMMMKPDDIQLALTKGIIQSIRESGIPDDRLKELLGPAYDSTNLTLSALTNSQVMHTYAKLEPWEERVVQAAVAKASLSVTSSLIPEGLAPDAIVFFEVQNAGRRDARNARLVVRLTGKPYDVAFSTDNKVLSEAKGLREYRVDMEAIAPNSRTKGIIWYGGGAIPTNATLEANSNEIVITYENGSLHRVIEENDFFSK